MADEECIPATVLTNQSKHYDKAMELKKLHINKYNKEPQFYVRAPGRVNIIGEHIDYCGYSVLPMALEQDIMMAASATTEGKLILSVTNSDSCHADFTCDINSFSIEVRKGESPAWHNYVLCGVKGVLELLPERQSSVGLIIAVSGNIPLSSGLSSSSALVVASAMATAYANKYSIDKLKMANVCAAAERYIGTQGGGMDQAISMLGTKGSAKHIMFNPLRAEDMKLPDGAVFVIAHSLAVLNKAKTSDYNQRVAECRIAAQIIAKKHGLNWESILTLADLQKQLNVSLGDMIKLVNKILHKDVYTREEICRELEVDEQKLNKVSLTNNTTHLNEFKLHQRALHVYMEASRVKAFCDICKADMDTPSKLKELGMLMQQSHESLRDLFECSHPNLDRIVELGKNVALGVRLTGAGWGGCTVALSTKDSCSSYIKLLKEKFYKNHPGAVDRDIDSLVFSTEPSGGAEIFTTA